MKRGETVREAAQVKIRIKTPLRAQLETAAIANGVSLSAEIVKRLELSLITQEIARDLIANVDKRLARSDRLVSESQKLAAEAVEKFRQIHDVIAEGGEPARAILKEAAVRLRKKREGGK